VRRIEGMGKTRGGGRSVLRRIEGKWSTTGGSRRLLFKSEEVLNRKLRQEAGPGD
jgi:hypothetical protein